MTARILDVITSCKGCPHRQYYSGGVYECRKVEQRLTEGVQMPAWCPLPSYPAPAQDAEREPIAWESMTPVYFKYITDSRYKKFSPAVRKLYRPYRCSACAQRAAAQGDA